MRGINKQDVSTQRGNPLSTKKVQSHTKKYLKMMRQREIDAMVEVTRNHLLDRYDG